MFKRILKWLGAILVVVAIAIAVFLTNLIWFRPWSLNLFYEKVFAEILFDRPGNTLAARPGGAIRHSPVTTENSTTNRLRINSANSIMWKRDLAQLHQYPLDRQSASQRLSTHVLIGFCSVKLKAKSGNGTIIPLISSSECRISFRRSWRIRTGC